MNNIEAEHLEDGLNEAVEWLEEKEEEFHSNENDFGQRNEIVSYKY